MSPFATIVCQYFSAILATFCATNIPQSLLPPEQSNRIEYREAIIKKSADKIFVTDYEWNYINFTWPSIEEYKESIDNGLYVPENNLITNIKFHKNKMFLALPRLRPGTPVTLATIVLPRTINKSVGEQKQKVKRNHLLTPYPSWDMNAKKSCTTLQNVQGIEIDRRGVLWVLDGVRINDFTICPPKIVLYDLNNAHKVVLRYIFNDDIALADGGLLTDLVLDESDGGYAYITDNSRIDPGLIVFSRMQRRAWKLRDRSMFAELNATNISVQGMKHKALSPINGIALSPLPARRDEERIVYYSALNAFKVYAISTKVLRNEKFCKSDQWRRYIKLAGGKTAISDGMIIDNQGDLYFGLIGFHGVAKWNIYDQFETSQRVDYNRNEIIWPNGFAMDSVGYIYVLSNEKHKIFDNDNYTLGHDSEDKITTRILRFYTGNQNYMYTRE